MLLACLRGTLDVLIHASAHKLDPLKLLPIVRSIARGMLHLHSRKPAILHRWGCCGPGACMQARAWARALCRAGKKAQCCCRWASQTC